MLSLITLTTLIWCKNATFWGLFTVKYWYAFSKSKTSGASRTVRLFKDMLMESVYQNMIVRVQGMKDVQLLLPGTRLTNLSCWRDLCSRKFPAGPLTTSRLTAWLDAAARQSSLVLIVCLVLLSLKSTFTSNLLSREKKGADLGVNRGRHWRDLGN